MKRNCWEIMTCGRTPGGRNAHELGVCPVVSSFEAHAINGGINGGRVCWAIDKTLCGGKVQGTWNEKWQHCSDCDFFHKVLSEEGQDLVAIGDARKIINQEGKDSGEPTL